MKKNSNSDYGVMYSLGVIIIGLQLLIIGRQNFNKGTLSGTLSSTNVKPIKNVKPIRIATQKVEEYKMIGYLHNKNSKTLPLYGRRVNVNHSNWHYYTKSDNYNYALKIYISHGNRDCGDRHGCKELYENDEVYIPEFNDRFRVKLYDTTIRYNPFVY